MKRLTKISTLSSLLLLLALPLQPGGFVSGSAACPSSGNIQIYTGSTPYYLKQLTVTALSTNTGIVNSGGSAVTTSTGTPLTASSSYNASDVANSIDPSTLYIACTVSADSVSWSGRN